MTSAASAPVRSTEASPSVAALIVGCLLLCVSVGLSAWMGREGVPLKVAAAPQGVLSMELPMTRDDALAIVRAWTTTRDAERSVETGRSVFLVDRFRAELDADRWLIVSYTLTLLVFLWWGCDACNIGGWMRFALLLLPLAAAVFDVTENHLMWLQMGGSDSSTIAAFTRLVSQLKFSALLAAVTGAVVLVGGGLRTRNVAGSRTTVACGSFTDLMATESAGIRSLRPTGSKDELTLEIEAAEEPRVSFRSSDYVGLALSGGGIRSATFNLGLLQQLSESGVLGLVDYISTVSGGGYIGGFLSAWLAGSHTGQLFPSASRPSATSGLPPEPGEVRHLREFSGFLAPRRGFFEVEMWRAVVAILSGLLPALAIAVSIIGLALVGFLTLTFVYACDWRLASAATAAAITAIVLGALEYAQPQTSSLTDSPSSQRHQTNASERADHHSTESTTEAMPAGAAPPSGSTAPQTAITPGRRSALYLWVSVAAVLLVLGVQLLLPTTYRGHTEERSHGMLLWTNSTIDVAAAVRVRGQWLDAPGANAYERWWYLVGTRDAASSLVQSTSLSPFFSPRLFDFAVTWMLVACVLLTIRLSHAVRPSPWASATVSTFDRVVMRLLGLGLVWFGLAAVWHVCVNVGYVRELALSAIVTGGAFAATRNWLFKLTGKSPGPSTWRTWLAPYLPLVLAYVTLLLIVALVGRALLDINRYAWLDWYGSALVMCLAVAFGLLVDPSRVGLHAFYRDRLGRAYLGARATSNAPENRATDSENSDDIRVAELRERPLHLVCCAANDLAGDPVATLQRGARSATISRHGFAMGNSFVEPCDLTLGAAVTASAAAFNSNMGALSIQFGPIVDFLLTALNLRLGLWVRHPRAATARPRRWPGLLFYREFFSQTSASRASTAMARGNHDLPVLERDIHLSDGGHFENLALYELVRRQCRYIILSDCGADPTVAFDDLGNALRRIREDFGVEVEIDVEPLRPRNGISRQHVAVGSIKYSRVNRGVLIYIKPAVTGSEPPDVLQYKTRNSAFPHESTGDQFYDEAQWESYRRLGAHSADRVFAFINEFGHPYPLTADWLFANAVAAWYPTPAELRDTVLAMTERFGQLENELRRERDSSLLREVFPELTSSGDYFTVRKAGVSLRTARTPAAGSVTATDLAFMLRATQLLEDVWMACRLDQLWAHPLNMGWVNLFARWTTAPTFRFWWPLLAPMYSPGFQSFLRHRIGVGVTGPMRSEDAPAANDWSNPIVNKLTAAPTGLASQWWCERSNQPRRWAGSADRFKFYALQLPARTGAHASESIELGVTAVTRRGPIAGWTSEDFFVPPSLWGAGYGGRMLHMLIDVLRKEVSDDGTCIACYVCVKAPRPGNDTNIAREDERAFVAQYRGQRFQQIRMDVPVDALSPAERTRRTEIESLELGNGPDDTILLLDLVERSQTGSPNSQA